MATPPIVTTSERRAFKRCPQRWWWAYREGLVAREMNDKLWFGIGIHEALAALYAFPGKKRGKDFIDVWRSFCDDDEISRAVRTRNGELDEVEWVNARALGEAMLTGYIEKYGWDPTWDVVYREEPFQIIIPDPEDAKRDIALFTSTFDGVYRDADSKKMYLMEHKTAASISTGHLPMDDQGGSYWAIATNVLRHKGVLGAKERIHGITYNFLKKALPDDRPRDADGYACNKPTKEHFVQQLGREGIKKPLNAMKLSELEEVAKEYGIRVLGDRSKVQGTPLFQREEVLRTPRERATQIRRIGAEVHAMNQFREGVVELYKNPTQDCSWDCQFFNLCQLHEQQQDFEEFRDAVFVVRNPYDRYMLRKSASA